MRSLLDHVWKNRFFDGYTVERIASFLCFAGLAVAILIQYPVHGWEGCASDFKTMYGSTVSLVHGVDAYSFDNIGAVFDANAVIKPASWYGHSPVYPPFTLALLAPLAALPMGMAVYVWFFVCLAALACATAALARVAGEEFGLPRLWRLTLIAACAAWPLSSFGLEMENVSVVVSALCIFAVAAPQGRGRWMRTAGLGLALLLKPHLAIWVVLALMLMPDRRGRWIAIRGALLALAVGSVICFALAARGDLGMQVASYRAVLSSELGGGSMSNSKRELMDVSAQIVSLNSLAGFFGQLDSVGRAGLAFVLMGSAGALAWASTRQISLQRYAVVGAWCSVGLLATYHRAHDGLVLIVVLPWLLARVRDHWQDATSWVMLAGLTAMGTAPRWETWWWLETVRGMKGVAVFLLYRQAPLSAFVVAAALVGVLVHGAWRERSAAMITEAPDALRA